MKGGFGVLWLLIAGVARGDDRLTLHQPPKALHPRAVKSDWPRFLGPADNATSPESHLLRSFPDSGPALVWELRKGESFTCPAIADGRLVYFHNVDDIDRVEGRDPETGEMIWEYSYPNRYRDRYGYGKGPRAAPVVADSRVYTLSATSRLHCLDLRTGALIWQRNLAEECQPGPYFFGHGCSPLVRDGRVIVPLGGASGVAVAAFDAVSGDTLWETAHAWSASYASPIQAELQGEKRILVFAGGDSKPPHGGLLVIDPETGAAQDAFAWRSAKYESVNASTPAVLADNRILLSEAYTEGGVLLRFDAGLKPVWRAPELKMHWTQPLVLGNYLYAFTGRNEPDAGLDCWDLRSGRRVWRRQLTWLKTVDGRSFGWGFFRGSILYADGRAYALGELGTLAILELTPQGVDITSQADLFDATQSWTPLALCQGLLYVVQNEPDLTSGEEPRILCYDLRRNES